MTCAGAATAFVVQHNDRIALIHNPKSGIEISDINWFNSFSSSHRILGIVVLQGEAKDF